MKLHRHYSEIKLTTPGAVVTVGNFDGLHKGHQQLIQRVVTLSQQLILDSIVVTFEPQPREYFAAKEAVPARLTRVREKIQLLQQTALDHLVVIRFNQLIAEMPAEEFVRDILIKQLKMRYLIIGEDFCFGKDRLGNFALLQQLARQYGFHLESFPEVKFKELRISSSRIRRALAEHDLILVEQLLGRKYSLSGCVCHGDKRGRTIGFPTANLFLHRAKSPVLGIYAVQMRGVTAQPITGVANIGSRPTVGGTRVLLEVFLFDFNQDIYGYHVEVDILQRLRDEERYDSFAELKTQIDKDVINARTYFANKTSDVETLDLNDPLIY